MRIGRVGHWRGCDEAEFAASAESAAVETKNLRDKATAKFLSKDIARVLQTVSGIWATGFRSEHGFLTPHDSINSGRLP